MLLTFEGIDGSGKSTQARLLVARLEAEGAHPLLLREPGGTDLSERVRTLLLERQDLHIEPLAELLLFSAARAQLVAERIRPALGEGRIVVCDRFYDSTTAYQGAGRGVEDLAWLRDFNRRVTRGLVPHRTYLLAIDVEAAGARRRLRHTIAEEPADDRIEATGRAFHQRVADAYDTLAAEEPQRILRLDATRPAEALHTTIWQDVQQLRAHRNQGVP